VSLAGIGTSRAQPGECAPGAQWVISTGATGPVVLGVFWPGSPLRQRRQYFCARARRLSILSWRLHSSEQKHDPRETRFSEIWDLQRTQKRSICDIRVTCGSQEIWNPYPFLQEIASAENVVLDQLAAARTWPRDREVTTLVLAFSLLHKASSMSFHR